MTQLLQNAAYGTALILAAAVLRRVLKDRLVPEARLALWAACLFRLLTPIQLKSVLSLWGLSRLFEPEQQPAAPVSGMPYVLPAAGVPAASAPQPNPVISWETALAAVCLAAGLLLAARFLLSWKRTQRAVACAIPLDCREERYSLLPKCARLREGPIEGAPLTFGAVHPIVVLSPGLDGVELDCVLAHEGVHARRRDNLWHYAMALALAVHWWNPAVWLMSRLLRRDVELSCDRAAVQALGEERRAEYANVLVSLSTQTGGPAFCHTFGRKATEERIRSIMKFKKTSIIGVIFSLTLVLALTAAFASEPKTDDGTVVYHGQTYNRADLSQATLDWLDWYLALPEEEQLAVSMVPPELIPGLSADTSDSSAAKYSSERTHSIRFENGVLKQFTITLSGLEEDLAVQVSNKSMTSAEAARVLDLAKFIAKDGVLDWTFQSDCGLTEENLGNNRTAICYHDKDGNQVIMSLSGIVASFILPQAMGDDPPTYIEPTYIEEGENIKETLGPVGEGDIIYDLDPKDEAWQDALAKSLISILSNFENVDHVSVFTKTTPILTDIMVEDLSSLSQEQKEAITKLVQGVFPGSDIVYSDQKGYQVTFPTFDEDGNSISEDGGIIGSRFYSYEFYTSDSETTVPPTPAVQPSASDPDLIPAMGTNGRVGYIRESDTHHGQYERKYGPINHPDDAMKYMAWLETQPDSYTIPLYDEAGNVIGEFPCGGGVSSNDLQASVQPAIDENGYVLDKAGNQIILDDNGNPSMIFKKTPGSQGGGGFCILENCPIAGMHIHNNGQVTNLWGEDHRAICLQMDCAETGAHDHGVYAYSGTAPVCTRDDCGSNCVHSHDGVTYKGWTGKSALPAASTHHTESHSSGHHSSSHH